MCFFSRVCDLMGGEIRVSLETLPTSSALIRLFPSMDPLVSLESTYLAKGLSTLFPSMDPLVYLESRHVAKDLYTR